MRTLTGPEASACWLSRRCCQRLGGIREYVQEGISLRLDLDAAMGGEGAPHETAVLDERLHVALFAELPDQPCRALDVGEQHRDGPAGQLGLGHSE